MQSSRLDRFVAAQDGVIGAVMAQLAEGQKTTHWMWFVFPQLRSLGRSEMAHLYGIEGLPEARAYAGHAKLAPRLRAGMELILSHAGKRSAEQIMGRIDAVKLRSSATLFYRAAPADMAVCKLVLAEFYDGAACALTEEALS